MTRVKAHERTPAHDGVDLPAVDSVNTARRAQACAVGLSVVAGRNRTRACVELAAIQALPGNVELCGWAEPTLATSQRE